MWRFQTAKKQSLMPSITENRGYCVLAGKGHEDYQEIKGKKYPMDERVLIADILAGK